MGIKGRNTSSAAGTLRRALAGFRLVLALACLSLAGPVPSPLRPACLRPGEVKVWVSLGDKGRAGSAVPVFSRRYENLPVDPAYLAALAEAGLRVHTALKWPNLVSGMVAREAMARIRALPFVAGLSEFPRNPGLAWPGLPVAPLPAPGLAKAGAAAELGEYDPVADTLRIREAHAWMLSRGMGAPGHGMRVAVIDDGFHLGHAVFGALRGEGRLKDQWDFVAGAPGAWDTALADSHGAMCLSLLGGYLAGAWKGVAPDAEFLLYRSEDDSREAYAEEDFLAAAIERAVDSGAQVISTSLAYRTEFDSAPDIPLTQLDGRTRPSSLAALGAARRNVVVVAALGNLDGKQTGPSTLSAPADADSILSVSIVDVAGNPCSYATTGPTADGRIKPELVSMGLREGCRVTTANTATAGEYSYSAGTSFAAPLIAGIAVLVRQARPSLSAQDIRSTLLATARNASAPNSRIGWGLANARGAVDPLWVSVRPESPGNRAGKSRPRIGIQGSLALPGTADAAGRAIGGHAAAGFFVTP